MPNPGSDPELAALRIRMDDLNRQLAAMLHDRARLCREIGARKAARGLPAIDREREAAMLAAIVSGPTATGTGDGFTPAALDRIFAAVFAESRAIVAAERG